MTLKLSVGAGNVLTLGLLALGLALTALSPGNPVIALAAWVLLGVGSHCPAHYLVGRICGISFTHYVIAPSALARMRVPLVSGLAARSLLPGLRIDKRSLRKAGRRCVYATLAAGAAASMSVPWAVTLVQLAAGDPYWSLTAGLQVFRIVFTMYFSPRGGDLYRARLYSERYAGRRD